MVQQHLSYKEMTDYGCFYTPQKFVDNLILKIKNFIPNYSDYFFLDSSCGYGTFLHSLGELKTIGCDIDPQAIKIAKSHDSYSDYYCKNTLLNFSRKDINLTSQDKIIVIGNPPYNDTTSRVKQDLKNNTPCSIDDDLKTRDLGISFMLSYNKLRADYVAILHPLSYMIKKANYDLLKPFFSNYKLIDHTIVNSQDFKMTSKTKGFPIIIALYKRDAAGLSYTQIMNATYKTFENETFDLKFDFIRNYISKYPSKISTAKTDDILFFTMRDINALNRSRTFIQEYSANSIIINKNKFAYYCYVDVFKQYIHKLPYYYGNIDVFINYHLFQQIKDVFITNSIERHPWLKEKNITYTHNDNYKLIDNYFDQLFNNQKS